MREYQTAYRNVVRDSTNPQQPNLVLWCDIYTARHRTQRRSIQLSPGSVASKEELTNIVCISLQVLFQVKLRRRPLNWSQQILNTDRLQHPPQARADRLNVAQRQTQPRRLSSIIFREIFKMADHSERKGAGYMPYGLTTQCSDSRGHHVLLRKVLTQILIKSRI